MNFSPLDIHIIK